MFIAALVMALCVGALAGWFAFGLRYRMRDKKRGFRLSENQLPFVESDTVPVDRQAHVHLAELRTKRTTETR